jgi:hypothetical protein
VAFQHHIYIDIKETDLDSEKGGCTDLATFGLCNQNQKVQI